MLFSAIMMSHFFKLILANTSIFEILTTCISVCLNLLTWQLVLIRYIKLASLTPPDSGNLWQTRGFVPRPFFEGYMERELWDPIYGKIFSSWLDSGQWPSHSLQARVAKDKPFLFVFNTLSILRWAQRMSCENNQMNYVDIKQLEWDQLNMINIYLLTSYVCYPNLPIIVFNRLPT